MRKRIVFYSEFFGVLAWLLIKVLFKKEEIKSFPREIFWI